jgi:hypothetical protein
VKALSFRTQGISPSFENGIRYFRLQCLKIRAFAHMTAIDGIKPFAEGTDDVHVVGDQWSASNGAKIRGFWIFFSAALSDPWNRLLEYAIADLAYLMQDVSSFR